MTKRLLLALLLVSLVTIPLEAKSKKCKERGKAVDDRIAELQKSADAILPIGSSKEETAHFFEINGLKMEMNKDQTEAHSYWQTKGCGPSFFCGDSVLLRVVINFDSAGKVSKKTIGGLYNNCL